jgi:TPR repeat protein
LKEFRPLAEQGDASAQYNLGVMYGNGEGVIQDYKAAFKWYKLAAEQGHAKAQYDLGVMYYNGQGVIQDYTHAHMWANIAASQGHKLAVKNRDIIAKQMTSTQIAAAQNLARECMAKNYKGC